MTASRVTRAFANRRTLTAVSALALAGAAGLSLSPAVGGPLNPPAGAPASTYKTLAEVEPRTAVQSLSGDVDSVYAITQPGSYYLTGNIQGVAGKHGIKITCNQVTLDLNGFSVTGAAQSLNGVHLVNSGFQYSVSVRNGTIAGFAGKGMDLSAGPSGRAENVRIYNCGAGMRVGPHSIVQTCEVTNNNGAGIYALDRAVVSSCVVNGNTNEGVIVGEGSTVTNTTSDYSTIGFLTGYGCTLQNCASKNCGTGYYLGVGSTVVSSTASTSDQYGFNAADGVTLTQCTARACLGIGFNLAYYDTMTACTATNNGGGGAQVNSGANISGCTFSSNTAFGLKANGSGNAIERCSVLNTPGDGIIINGFSTVTNCMIQGNSASGPAAGVRMLGTANHIESNIFNSNKVGVETTVGGNFIVKNSFAYNPTRWSLAAGNYYSQVIVTPAAGFTSTDPWANFGY